MDVFTPTTHNSKKVPPLSQELVRRFLTADPFDLQISPRRVVAHVAPPLRSTFGSASVSHGGPPLPSPGNLYAVDPLRDTTRAVSRGYAASRKKRGRWVRLETRSSASSRSATE